MDLDLSAFLKAMDGYACWDPSIMRTYISCINISMCFWVSLSDILRPSCPRSFILTHRESPLTDDTAKVSDWPFPAVYVQSLPICTDKGRGELHIGFRGVHEGVSAVTIQDTGCSAKELKEIRSRNMVVYENVTSASPATCKSSLR